MRKLQILETIMFSILLAVLFAFGLSTVSDCRAAIIGKVVELSRDEDGGFSASRLNKISSAVESELAAAFHGRDFWVDLNGLVWRFKGKRIVDGGKVVLDKYGYLHLPKAGILSEEQVQRLVQPIDLLARECAKTSTEFLFVQAPYKVVPGKSTLPHGVADDCNRNSDQLLKSLARSQVPILDLRSTLVAEWKNPERAFFKTDHHWTSMAAWWAAGIIAKNLAFRDSGKKELLLPPTNSMGTLSYKRRFLGSQGVRTGKLYAGIDDFEVLYPENDTKFSLEKYSSLSLEEKYSGDFLDVFIDLDLLDSSYVNAYNAFLHYSYIETIIRNNKNSGGAPRLLLIADSFGRSIAPYLALGTSELAYIDPQDGRFAGDIGAYLVKFKPDIVIVLFTASIPAVELKMD